MGRKDWAYAGTFLRETTVGYRVEPWEAGRKDPESGAVLGEGVPEVARQELTQWATWGVGRHTPAVEERGHTLQP